MQASGRPPEAEPGARVEVTWAIRRPRTQGGGPARSLEHRPELHRKGAIAELGERMYQQTDAPRAALVERRGGPDAQSDSVADGRATPTKRVRPPDTNGNPCRASVPVPTALEIPTERGGVARSVCGAPAATTSNRASTPRDGASAAQLKVGIANASIAQAAAMRATQGQWAEGPSDFTNSFAKRAAWRRTSWSPRPRLPCGARRPLRP